MCFRNSAFLNFSSWDLVAIVEKSANNKIKATWVQQRQKDMVKQTNKQTKNGLFYLSHSRDQMHWKLLGTKVLITGFTCSIKHPVANMVKTSLFTIRSHCLLRSICFLSELSFITCVDICLLTTWHTGKSEQCCRKTGRDEIIAPLGWFSSLGSSGSCFLRSTEWSEMQRMLKLPSSCSCVAP